MRGCERRRYADRGFVTAEAALALPVLVMVTALLVGGLVAMLVQIQCVDAARSGARAAARQDSADRVKEVVRGIAPRGATVTVSREESQVRVVVVAKTPLRFDVRAEAVADAEETTGAETVDAEVTAGAGKTASVGKAAGVGVKPDAREAAGVGATRDAGKAGAGINSDAGETPHVVEAPGAGDVAHVGETAGAGT
jgi:Flp pilus assembly protein TadG